MPEMAAWHMGIPHRGIPHRIRDTQPVMIATTSACKHVVYDQVVSLLKAFCERGRSPESTPVTWRNT